MGKKETRSKVYGAYGSNMNVEQMGRRCPKARVLGTGTLKNYRLTFRGRACGVANVERTRGKTVPIVLWEITPECEQALDVYEGFPRLYVKRVVEILTSEGHVVNAMIYVMAQQYETCAAEPGVAYLQTIRQGYRDHQISLDALRQALLENVRELSAVPERAFWKLNKS
jgi:cation transport regulator ChaC